MAIPYKLCSFRSLPTSLLAFSLICASLSGCDSSLESPKAASTSTDELSEPARIEPLQDSLDLLDELRELPGIADVEEIASEHPDYQAIAFTIEQPVHHHQSSGKTFKQRVELLYRGPLAPNVLVAHSRTLDNAVFDEGEAQKDEPESPEPFAWRMGANEISVETRYHGKSIPDAPNYSALTLGESSADLHRVVETLKPIMAGSWISTGDLDGGTLAVHHRRHYPFDTHATVAFNAPAHLSFQDARYQEFMSTVGSKACRDKLLDLQMSLLNSREEVIKEIDSIFVSVPDPKLSFKKWPGGLDQMLDYLVHDLPYWFWTRSARASSPKDCEFDLETDGILEHPFFFPAMLSLVSQEDSVVEERLAEHVHQHTELGFPKWGSDQLAPLYKHDIHDMSPYLLGTNPRDYSPSTLMDLSFWTSVSMNRLIMIHGEFDPSSAARIPLASPRIGEAYTWIAPTTGRGADISRLNAKDQANAIAALERWTGATWTPIEPDDSDKSENSRKAALQSQLQVSDEVMERFGDILISRI